MTSYSWGGRIESAQGGGRGQLSSTDDVAQSLDSGKIEIEKITMMEVIELQQDAVNMLAAHHCVLSPYFNHLGRYGLVEAQHLTGTLISGSMAILFFNDTNYTHSDLDIYVQSDRRHTLFTFLSEQGYHFIPLMDVPLTLDTPLDEIECMDHVKVAYDFLKYDSETINAVYSFQRDGNAKTVQVVATIQNPLYTILNFHLTCVMNFLTYSYAVSLYPALTFIKKASLANNHHSSPSDDAICKYKRC
ncbi:hypothetical protein ARMGADRAFT_1028431 [Armillaria gallica]|uniref:Nucleotidyltransferase family protein n=1 Tax=Armillaria gallica TaxID=47427 RepID=A0A2H3DQV9_ARMGA|nr:hypothetical protein ARMGADRAFT_1028431 [Armillaria gallica]